MRRHSHREPKLRTVTRTLDEKLSVVEDDIRTVIYNERITRARVDTIEAFFGMPWYDRAWWMLTGRSKYFTVTAMVDAAEASVDQAEPGADVDEASQALGVGA